MKAEKVVAFFVWCCIAPFFCAMGLQGWHDAIWPPSYMATEYAWRVLGASIMGTLFPAIAILALAAQVAWWFEKEEQ